MIIPHVLEVKKDLRLKEKDLRHISREGFDEIEKDARFFIETKLRVRRQKDGMHTPLGKHPVFTAQRALGICCRGCLEEMYRVPKNKTLDDEDVNALVEMIMQWIHLRYMEEWERRRIKGHLNNLLEIRLIKLVNKKGKIKLTDAAEALGVGVDYLGGLVRLLERHDRMGLGYSVRGDPILIAERLGKSTQMSERPYERLDRGKLVIPSRPRILKGEMEKYRGGREEGIQPHIKIKKKSETKTVDNELHHISGLILPQKRHEESIMKISRLKRLKSRVGGYPFNT